MNLYIKGWFGCQPPAKLSYHVRPTGPDRPEGYSGSVKLIRCSWCAGRKASKVKQSTEPSGARELRRNMEALADSEGFDVVSGGWRQVATNFEVALWHDYRSSRVRRGLGRIHLYSTTSARCRFSEVLRKLAVRSTLPFASESGRVVRST